MTHVKLRSPEPGQDAAALTRRCLLGYASSASALVALGRLPRAEAAEPRRIGLQIRDRQVVGGGKAIRVIEGDMVELFWSTDERVELHLHGYDIELTVTPDGPAVMRFEAYATGRFPVTSHGFGDHRDDDGGHDAALIYFEVHPH